MQYQGMVLMRIGVIKCDQDASYASRLISDDGYAICELHDETVDCQVRKGS